MYTFFYLHIYGFKFIFLRILWQITLIIKHGAPLLNLKIHELNKQYELVMGCEQVALRSIWQSTQKIAERLSQKLPEIQRETWLYYATTQRVAIKSKTDIRMRSLWCLANVQSQMFTTLSQSMAMVWADSQSMPPSRSWKNSNDGRLTSPQIIMMGHKFPFLTKTDYKWITPQFPISMPLTQKGDLQCIP